MSVWSPIFISLRAQVQHGGRNADKKGRQEKTGDKLQEMPSAEMQDLEIGPAIEFAEKNDYGGLVLLGDPGSGKTTLLKFLALCLAQARPAKQTGIKTRRVPIYLPLRMVEDYEDDIDWSGELRIADLGGNFTIRLSDGTPVVGSFTPDQESLITEALKEHSTQRLRVRGKALFSGETRKVKKIIMVETLSLEPVEGLPFESAARPIWEIATEIGASVPEEEWARVPADAAKNLDHYLYGSRKSEE
ncbi:MAG: NACHT domain-containing protein [Planctomycetota bacterium]|nr:NACHT domain-containing protein [Planctomycetota bacterium]